MKNCKSCRYYTPTNCKGEKWICTKLWLLLSPQTLIPCGFWTAKNEEVKVETKNTNPKDACGIKKVPSWFIPTRPLLMVGLAMMEGARKYGAFNWRKAGVRMSVYYDAIKRHLDSWKEGEDIDPDSEVHHLIKAAACCFVVMDSILMGNCTDDRPIRYPNGLNIKDLNEIAAKLIEKYPDCAKPFLEKDNG